MPSVLPRAVSTLSEELRKLPGIGPKSARRLAIHLLRQPRSVVANLGDSLKNLHANVRTCQVCFNLSEREECNVCRSDMRDRSLICVVESPLDVEAIERTDNFNGLYHVLGGVLSPLEGVGVEQLTMNELLGRIRKEEISEVILALNPTLEGEATARHILQNIDEGKVKTTRLGRGLPTGGDIEYADAITLSASFEGRREL